MSEDPKPTKASEKPAPAYRDGKLPGPEGAEVQIRPSGPDAMRDRPGKWDPVDEAADESFPASDPPAH